MLMQSQIYEAEGRPPTDNAKLIEHFRALVARVLEFAKGWCVLGSLLLDRAALTFEPSSFGELLREAESALHRALSLDALLADAAFALSVARYLQRDLQGFHRLLSLSLELGPSHLEHFHFGGTLLCLSGEVHAGLGLIARGGLSRHQAPLYRISHAVSCFAAGRLYDASAALADLPEDVPVTAVALVRTLVLADAGDDDGARLNLAEFIAGEAAMQPLVYLSIERWILDPALAARATSLFRRVLGEASPPPR